MKSMIRTTIIAAVLLIEVNTINIAYQNYNYCEKFVPKQNTTGQTPLNDSAIQPIPTTTTNHTVEGCPWLYEAFTPKQAPIIENIIEVMGIVIFGFMLGSMLIKKKPKAPPGEILGSVIGG